MSWKRPNIGSRVSREVHARFWESPEVRSLRATRHICPFLPFDDVRLSYQKATDGHVSNQSDPNFRSLPHKLHQNLYPQHPPLPQHQPKIDRHGHIGDEAEHQQRAHPDILEAPPHHPSRRSQGRRPGHRRRDRRRVGCWRWSGVASCRRLRLKG